jgi:hypothetical protein
VGRQKGCKSTKAEVRGTKSKPQRKYGDTRTRLKEIVCYIMFEDEANVNDSYDILNDPLTVDKWLDPIEIAVMAEKEFGLPESEWPDEVFQSFGKLFSHLESLLHHSPECQPIAQNQVIGGR